MQYCLFSNSTQCYQHCTYINCYSASNSEKAEAKEMLDDMLATGEQYHVRRLDGTWRKYKMNIL